MLLAALAQPTQYVPIDVSGEQLEANARALRHEVPGLDVAPVHGDYTGHLVLPRPPAEIGATLAFFPGSTLGNFEPSEARAFLARLRVLAGDRGMLVLGTDSNQDASSLVRAYDDRDGVTAAFDLNVLAHVNRTHAATFDLDRFVHRAVWNAERSRVEMHLVSQRAQHVRVGSELVAFASGESIVTEHCYKHSADVIASMIVRAGWDMSTVFVGNAARMRLWVAVAA
jgi:L-histidine N-alpha-methyltransferase